MQVVWHYSKPFFYRDKNGNLQGIKYEMMRNFFSFLEEKYNLKLHVHWEEARHFAEMYRQVKELPTQPGVFGVASLSITDARKKEVRFTPTYFPDIEVIISSENVKIAESIEEFQVITKSLKGITVPNTTFDINFEKLKQKYLGNVALDTAEDSKQLIEKVATSPNYFGYIHLPIYATALQEGKRMKRQAFYRVERQGYAVIYPLENDWQAAVDDFFGRAAFKAEMNQIIQKYLGTSVKDLVWELASEDGQSAEVKILTREKEIQALEIKQKGLENEYQRMVNNGLIASVILIVIFLLILFN